MNVNLERADEFEFRRGRTRKTISFRSQADSRWVRNMNKLSMVTRLDPLLEAVSTFVYFTR